MANSSSGYLHVMGSLTRSGAGVAEAVWNLALAQSRLAADPASVRILGLDDAGARFDLPVTSTGFRPCGPTPPGWVPGLASKIYHELRDGDVLHSHGHWLHANWAAYAAARRAGKRVRLVISPHGMLGPEPMRRSPVRKRIALSLVERRGLAEAALIIAASAREREELRLLGIEENKIVEVPFGIWPEEYAVPEEQERREWDDFAGGYPRIRRGNYVLFLGRLAAIKAPLDLLDAWGALGGSRGGKQLVLAGPDGGERAALERGIAEQGLGDCTFLLPPVQGPAKRALLRGSRFLVLCSRYESFGLVVLESLAAGRPVLASSNTPWPALPRVGWCGCGWTYEDRVGELEAALGTALAQDDERLAAMGGMGRHFVHRGFTWTSVARRTLRACRWAFAPDGPAGHSMGAVSPGLEDGAWRNAAPMDESGNE